MNKIIMTFEDGSVADLETRLETKNDGYSFTVAWVESWRFTGGPESQAAKHVETRTAKAEKCR